MQNEPKLKHPVLLKRFIDDGFGIFYGIKEVSKLINGQLGMKWNIWMFKSTKDPDCLYVVKLT